MNKYKHYNVTKDFGNVLKIFNNLTDAKKYAKETAIKLTDRIHIDLFMCDYGIYQYEDEICTYDPTGKIIK